MRNRSSERQSYSECDGGNSEWKCGTREKQRCERAVIQISPVSPGDFHLARLKSYFDEGDPDAPGGERWVHEIELSAIVAFALVRYVGECGEDTRIEPVYLSEGEPEIWVTYPDEEEFNPGFGHYPLVVAPQFEAIVDSNGGKEAYIAVLRRDETPKGTP